MNHFISGLCRDDGNFPLKLWDKFLPQCLITLNLLRGYHINPNVLAYSQVHGSFSLNRTPLYPPGTRVLVLKKNSS